LSADARFKSLIDRILRLKEEQDSLAADIRDIYAEAKGEGYDKTAMGQVVAHLRKVEKVGVSAIEESQTIFDVYLSAYQRGTGTVVATHTHEEPTYGERLVAAAKEIKTITALDATTFAVDFGVSHPLPVSSQGSADKAGEVAPPSSPAEEFTPPTFLVRAAKPLRPHCLDHENCAGYGSHTCHRCTIAAAGQNEAA